MLILASQSPQRKLILEELGLKFKTIPAHINEEHGSLTQPGAISKYIAENKAKKVALMHPKSWVIGCDTIVVFESGEIAIKPKDRADAKRMLKEYQGANCKVYSGLALINEQQKILLSDYEQSKIVFHNFPDHEIEEYLDSNEWEGRSGGMTIEGKGDWTKKIEGEYWNILGLPVDLLKKMLKKQHLV